MWNESLDNALYESVSYQKKIDTLIMSMAEANVDRNRDPLRFIFTLSNFNISNHASVMGLLKALETTTSAGDIFRTEILFDLLKNEWGPERELEYDENEELLTGLVDQIYLTLFTEIEIWNDRAHYLLSNYSEQSDFNLTLLAETKTLIQALNTLLSNSEYRPFFHAGSLYIVESLIDGENDKHTEGLNSLGPDYIENTLVLILLNDDFHAFSSAVIVSVR